MWVKICSSLHAHLNSILKLSNVICSIIGSNEICTIGTVPIMIHGGATDHTTLNIVLRLRRSSYIVIYDVLRGGGSTHTPAKGPSVTGSTGLALGMCVGVLARHIGQK